MTLLELAKKTMGEHNGAWNEWSPVEIARMVEYLIEGNSKEDLALLYLQKLSRDELTSLEREEGQS
jgi:hypothetical protein